MSCEVEILNGKVKGQLDVNYLSQQFYSFHAIPYAKPPIGPLRFKDPVPIDNWEGVLDATKDNNGCYAPHMFFDTRTGTEDCLYLNVYTRNILPAKKLPVMVWIHGGGFTSGSNTREFYGPKFLMMEDIVLVSINYRLGALGFLSLENAELGVPGNAGFKDMVMALKWVQANIEYFSGDANNVTIFGESAGSGSVHLLILSPMTKGLFHKAILQSGCALNAWVEGRRFAKDLLNNLDFNGNPDDEREVLSYLQSVAVNDLLTAQIQLGDPIRVHERRSIGFILEDPNSENPFITKNPIEIIRSGSYQHVPIMIGFTDCEGLLFEIMQKKSGKFSFITDYQTCIPFCMNLTHDSAISKAVANKIRDYYYGSEEPSTDNIQKYYDLLTDVFFLHGITTCIKEHLITSTHPIYFYRFTIDTPINCVKSLVGIDYPGACHGDELSYLFNNDYCKSFEENSVEEKSIMLMVKMWTNFAKNGNPNPIKDSNTIWQSVQLNNMAYLNIGNEIETNRFDERGRMQFWDQIYEMSRQHSKL